MWKAVFACVGAVVGPFVAWFAGIFVADLLAAVVVAPPTPGRPPVYWLVLPPILYFAVPIGGALFALLGFCFGSGLDGGFEAVGASEKWRAVFAAVGAAIGPMIGLHAVARLSLRLSGHGGWKGLDALLKGIVSGLPIGGILFCLLGLCAGFLLDRRSRFSDFDRK